jgi:N utilization substance protein B
MSINITELFPLSKTKQAKGTRRLAREKVLQILLAFDTCQLPINDVFSHIFYRDFNFGEDFDDHREKLLRPDEIYELEADIPILWKEEEVEFGRNLINHCLNNREEIDKLLNEFAKNWDIDRIAPIDKILIIMSTSELLNFPEIPPKVSINEALDIAKKYSTDKSKLFINGILDAILDKLKSDNKLNKSGRGLKEDNLPKSDKVKSEEAESKDPISDITESL